MSMKEAWRFASASLRGFTWGAYAPFFWILAIEVIYLFLSVNLGAPWGMATAGALAARIAGDGTRHYPAIFVALPAIFSYVDAALYTVLGAAFIPLAITRVLRAPSRAPGRAPTASRVRGAVLPTFLAFALVLVLLFFWEIAIPRIVAPLVAIAVRLGPLANLVTWVVGVLVGLALSALALCVPIVAVREGGGLRALGAGFGDGFRFLPSNYPIIVLFSAPALVIQAIVQLMGGLLVNRLTPEVMPVLLLAYAILASLANYFVYSAATRLHASAVREGA
ncbi:MAG TPA: hypothetical protein VF363_04590 [Candidatus Eisenbacteria bacterium]